VHHVLPPRCGLVGLHQIVGMVQLAHPLSAEHRPV